MSAEISFVIPGDPKSKSRPRFRAGQGGYTDAKTREAEKAVVAAFRDAYPWWAPMSCRMRLEVIFFRRTMHRADVDNLVKLTTDALNGVLYVDDEQLDDVRGLRFYGARDEACTQVRVWPLDSSGHEMRSWPLESAGAVPAGNKEMKQ